jgi:hypothetical protein
LKVNLLITSVQILLGPGFLLLPERWVKELVITSTVWAFIVWYGTQGFGMILTGMTTDFNSGLLLVVMALACWPRVKVPQTASVQVAADPHLPEASGTAQQA